MSRPGTTQGSRRSRAFAFGLGSVLRPTLNAASHSALAVKLARKALDELASHQHIAKGITLSSFRTGEVKGIWLDNPASHEDDRVILYLHGGAFVVCSPDTHKGLVARLCKASDASALLLDYSLAPERTFPAANEQALAAYRHLLGQGYSPTSILVAGDSAGGYLVSRLIADLHAGGLPTPAAVLLLSPFLDLTAERALTEDHRHRDPFVPPRAAARVGRMYAGAHQPGGRELDVLGGDKSYWPPTLIQVGGTECLLPDSERLTRKLRRAGVAVELQVWPDQVHVFQAFPTVVPEARAAVRTAGGWLRSVSSVRAPAAGAETA